MRSTGISRRLVAGSRYNANVASRAASVNLSERTARASGSLRQASIAARVPSRIPACGPPSSLSPEKTTASTPLARASALGARGREVQQEPAAQVVQAGGTVRMRDACDLLRGDLGGEARNFKIGPVDLE